MSRQMLILSYLTAGMLLAACAAPEPTATATTTASETAQPTETHTPTQTLTPSETPLPSETPTPSQTLSPTPDFVWGTINVAQASCRFGPGGGYLLRTTRFEGDVVEVQGYMELNENWWFVRLASNHKQNCWVSQELITLGGDFADMIYPIDDPHLVLPYTTQPYGALKGVNARRSGNLVLIQWEPFDYLPGDDSLQNKYLVEVWVCQAGEFVFRAYGTNSTSIEVQDEQSCSEPSRGRAFGADKHGYTNWVSIPWPG